MPLQNRVSPEGEIVATMARGTMYGNRGGCFHYDDGRLKARTWANRQWICCVLDFKGRRRLLRQPGKFTELFFLDEATAFAAGHRPCFECRRADAVAFQTGFAKAHGIDSPRAPDMDVVLHAERLTETGRQRRFVPDADALLDGVMVRFEYMPWLVLEGKLRPWSHGGYGPPITIPALHYLECLTPPSTIATIRAGYRPQLHPSAQG